MEQLEDLNRLDQLGQSISGEQDARTIAVMSGKGGVGKTTTALNLGAALADQGQETVILDMDLDTANLPLELGYLSAGSTTIQDILQSDLDESMLSVVNRVRERLGIIPSAIEQQQVDWTADELKAMTEELDKWVLIDTPPGIGEHQLRIMRAVDAVIVVMTPSESAFIDGMKIVSLAEQAGTEVLGVVINRAGESRYDLEPKDIRESLAEIEVIGTIPEDDRVKKTKNKHKPLIDIHPNAPAAVAYQELAAALSGGSYEAPNTLKRLIGRVRR